MWEENEEEQLWFETGTIFGVQQWRDDEGKIRKGYYPHLNKTCYYNKAGTFHRLRGPSIVFYNEEGTIIDQLWFYHGKQVECSSQEEFDRLIRLKAFW